MAVKVSDSSTGFLSNQYGGGDVMEVWAKVNRGVEFTPGGIADV